MKQRCGSPWSQWLVAAWVMVRVLARLNGTSQPTVELSINTNEIPAEIPHHLVLVEQAQQALGNVQRFVHR